MRRMNEANPAFSPMDFHRNTPEYGFAFYVDNLLRSVVNGGASNGELAVFLNRQLDEWEIEAGCCDAMAHGPLVVDTLEQIIDALERAPADLAAWRRGLGAIAA
jgi:hypothetical protein